MAWLMLGCDIDVGVLTGVELVECTEAPELISTAEKTLHYTYNTGTTLLSG